MDLIWKGVYKFLVDQNSELIQERLKTNPDLNLDLANSQARKLIKAIQECLQVKDTHQPLFLEGDKENDRFYSDNNLWNPESKNVAILIYIYSMQFGNPALFTIQNSAMRTGDIAYLESLGPYSVAMACVTVGSEHFRDDKI